MPDRPSRSKKSLRARRPGWPRPGRSARLGGLPSRPPGGADVLPDLDPSALGAFAQVLLIDIVLAGDNAVAVGLAASGLPAGQRRKAIVAGILLAAAFRLLCAFAAVQLLQIAGLMLAGGVVLLWVAWRLARELRRPVPAPAGAPGGGGGKTMARAMVQIAVADAAMSLDNVLAVAAAAREHPAALVVGLALSIALMAFAATAIARLLDRRRWIAWAGVGLIAWVACAMIYEDGLEIARGTFA